MVFGNGVKNIQTAGYNGARTVFIFLFFKFLFQNTISQKALIVRIKQ